MSWPKVVQSQHPLAKCTKATGATKTRTLEPMEGLKKMPSSDRSPLKRTTGNKQNTHTQANGRFFPLKIHPKGAPEEVHEVGQHQAPRKEAGVVVEDPARQLAELRSLRSLEAWGKVSRFSR